MVGDSVIRVVVSAEEGHKMEDYRPLFVSLTVNTNRKQQFSLKTFGQSREKPYLCTNRTRHASRRPANQGGAFFLYRAMRYNKQPISINDQIAILKGRGLIFADEQNAQIVLENISYFRLAGYWRTMEQNISTHLFRPGSRFEDVVARYNFDSELKTLIFAAIQQIEISVRTRIIHFFSLAHGAFWFLDDTLAEDEDLFNENLSYLRTELSRSHDEFIAEHFRKYDEPDMPPAWKTLEVASFGTLSKLYKNMNDNAVKKQVARSFNIPQHKCLQSWLATLTIVRNTCAHHARLWNAHFSMVPRTNERMRGNWIANRQFSSDKLYPSLCCIAYWLNSINPQNTFVQEFKSLLKKYSSVQPAMMGFPRGWENEPLWQ